jgi:two-component system, chemotaxis family, response regulator Rcp1
MVSKHITILVAEDNPGDVFLIKRILSKFFLHQTIAVANDGEEALDYLYKSVSEGERHTKPAFILLDLNLPKIDGKEILSRIKKHEELRTIPIIMFSSSQSLSDISAAYDLHANCYIVKPYDLDEYNRVLENLCTFWVKTVSLPVFSTN